MAAMLWRAAIAGRGHGLAARRPDDGMAMLPNRAVVPQRASTAIVADEVALDVVRASAVAVTSDDNLARGFVGAAGAGIARARCKP